MGKIRSALKALFVLSLLNGVASIFVLIVSANWLVGPGPVANALALTAVGVGGLLTSCLMMPASRKELDGEASRIRTACVVGLAYGLICPGFAAFVAQADDAPGAMGIGLVVSLFAFLSAYILIALRHGHKDQDRRDSAELE